MSKKLILSLALSGFMLSTAAQTTVAPAIPRNEKIEQQIETLLKKMTLEEKVGQMCELTIDLLQKRANPFAGIDPQNFKVDDQENPQEVQAGKGVRPFQGHAFPGSDDADLHAHPGHREPERIPDGRGDARFRYREI